MCGILGVVGRSDPGRFERALDTLSHRGPDGRGVWRSEAGDVTIGHRRLSILEPGEGGRQPMSRGDLLISFNGEIYNFLEIRRHLESEGEVFQTRSDTEVLLAAYCRWGENCLERLNGMWAFAIWNKKKQSLFLARDRFGKKPLFYSFHEGSLIFGSEMKALVSLIGSASPSKDFHWMASHPFDYEATDKCLIQGIRRFPAGSWASITLGDLDRREFCFHRFWETLDHLEEFNDGYDSQVARFRDLFLDSCRLRMRSDVPIGTALSGGIDSSAVACTMRQIAENEPDARMAREWQHAFVATFPGSELDEREYAESVATHIDSQAHYLPIDPEASLERLDRDLYLFEEIYITSPMPMMRLYGAVREHGVKVTIDGHGADELLVGYAGFRHTLNDTLFDPKRFDHILETCELPSGRWRDRLAALRDLHGGGRGLIRFLSSRLCDPKQDDISRKQLGYLNQVLYDCFHSNVLPTLLRNYDRYSMANGVEIRMPFMDHRLVSYCFSLPWQSKAPGKSTLTKMILRDAVGDWMPEKIRNRRSKIGFNTPFLEWMKGPWREFLLDTIRSSAFANCQLIDPASVRQEIESSIENPVSADRADRAWNDLMPFLWERAFIGNAVDPTKLDA